MGAVSALATGQHSDPIAADKRNVASYDRSVAGTSFDVRTYLLAHESVVPLSADSVQLAGDWFRLSSGLGMRDRMGDNPDARSGRKSGETDERIHAIAQASRGLT